MVPHPQFCLHDMDLDHQGASVDVRNLDDVSPTSLGIESLMRGDKEWGVRWERMCGAYQALVVTLTCVWCRANELRRRSAPKKRLGATSYLRSSTTTRSGSATDSLRCGGHQRDGVVLPLLLTVCGRTDTRPGGATKRRMSAAKPPRRRPTRFSTASLGKLPRNAGNAPVVLALAAAPSCMVHLEGHSITVQRMEATLRVGRCPARHNGHVCLVRAAPHSVSSLCASQLMPALGVRCCCNCRPSE